MNTRRGRPRELTRPQIRQVLLWHQSRLHFRKLAGSLRAFSKESGVPLHVLRRALAGDTMLLAAQSRRIRTAVMRWLLRYRRFSEHALTAAQLAAQLGVSRNTLYDCIRRQGRYQRSLRDSAGRRERVVSRPALLSRHATAAEVAYRAAVLNRWPRHPQALTESVGEGPMDWTVPTGPRRGLNRTEGSA